mgnify:CR=1 FL=1
MPWTCWPRASPPTTRDNEKKQTNKRERPPGAPFRLSKKPLAFRQPEIMSLFCAALRHENSRFAPRTPCRARLCATFDPIRGGLCPLELPLRKRTSDHIERVSRQTEGRLWRPFLCPARTSTDALYVSARADVGIRPYVQFSGGLFVGGDAHIAPPRPQARNSRRRQAANDSFFPGIDSLTAGRYNLTCMRVCKFG